VSNDDPFNSAPAGSKMFFGFDSDRGISSYGTYYMRADGGWHKDQRKDEDPRHVFGWLLSKTEAVGISAYAINEPWAVTKECERCGRLLGDILKEHLTSCPAQHPRLPSGDIQCSWNILPLCEGERRHSPDTWAGLT
jgi:hypothetical protein